MGCKRNWWTWRKNILKMKWTTDMSDSCSTLRLVRRVMCLFQKRPRSIDYWQRLKLYWLDLNEYLIKNNTADVHIRITISIWLLGQLASMNFHWMLPQQGATWRSLHVSHNSNWTHENNLVILWLYLILGQIIPLNALILLTKLCRVNFTLSTFLQKLKNNETIDHS